MDAFYVSVEIRDNPELADKPVAVGGKSTNRGVLSTCNYIARQYGVHSAMPTAVALRKCPDLILVPGRMEVYKEISSHIRQIMSDYTDLIEPLSLDEAYLDVTDCERCQGSATLIAQEIRQRIFDELRLTASAGIAPIKFLAKIASDLNKPNGQYVITPYEVTDFIETMPLSKISGVGKVTTEKLASLQLFTGGDIRQQSEEYMTEHFGKYGRVLWKRCHGIDSREIETTRTRKSVGVERTFATDIIDPEQLKNILFDKLIPELKKRSEHHLKTRGINKLGVKVKFNDFHQTTKEYKHQDFDNEVFLQLLNEALQRGRGKPVRLLGAHIGLDEELKEALQLSLPLQ